MVLVAAAVAFVSFWVTTVLFAWVAAQNRSGVLEARRQASASRAMIGQLLGGAAERARRRWFTATRMTLVSADAPKRSRPADRQTGDLAAAPLTTPSAQVLTRLAGDLKALLGAGQLRVVRDVVESHLDRVQMEAELLRRLGYRLAIMTFVGGVIIGLLTNATVFALLH